MTLNFHSRILLFFVGLILLSQIGITVATLIAAHRNAYAAAEQQLQIAERVMHRSLDSREQLFRSSAGTLASDPAFRAAVAAHDRAAIVSALATQGARVNAVLVMLMDEAGRITASTDAAVQSAPQFSSPEFLDSMSKPADQPMIIAFSGKLMQLVVAPLRSPDAAGRICMGFAVGEDLAEQIKDISGVEISLIVKSADTSPVVIASTLPEQVRASLDRRVNQLAAMSGTSVKLGGVNYLTAVMPGVSAATDPFFTVLQLSSDQVTAPLVPLRRELLWCGGIIMITCLLAAILCARMLSQPVQALAAAANSLRLSKRRENHKSGGDDELANLASTFHALARRAHYDALTGLPNRSLVSERIAAGIARAQSQGEPMAVVFIDLNDFKKINDTLGHEMGDLVLRKAAQRLMQSMRASDTVARFGGDEFVLVLDGVDQSGALKIVDNLIAIIAMPMQSDTGTIQVGMSAGIAIYPDHGSDRGTLLRLADAAMYESKSRKFGPVVAKPAAQSPASETQPPVRDFNSTQELTGTWGSGHWAGKDLRTQRTKILTDADI